MLSQIPKLFFKNDTIDWYFRVSLVNELGVNCFVEFSISPPRVFFRLEFLTVFLTVFLGKPYFAATSLLGIPFSKSSVIRQKSESQSASFKKTRHAKFSKKRTLCVSRGKKCSIIGKFSVHCLLVTSVLRFAFCFITVQIFYNLAFHTQRLLLRVCLTGVMILLSECDIRKKIRSKCSKIWILATLWD